jgi:hypothetical protein
MFLATSADFIRMIILAQASWVLIQICVALYRASLVRYHKQDRRRCPQPRAILWGLSYFLATVLLCDGVLARFGERFSWRTAICILVFITGDIALWSSSYDLKKQLDRRF